MKKEIFLQYLEAVLKLYGIKRDVLFSGSKKPDAIEARQMLYYLCYKRQIRQCHIRQYMVEQGYDPKPAPILNGIKRVTDRVNSDNDHRTIVDRISNSIFI